MRDNLCPELGQAGAKWNNRRVLIFTEYTDTKRYLEEQIKAAIDGSDLANKRIDTFHGGMGNDRREAIKAAFNDDPVFSIALLSSLRIVSISLQVDHL